VYDKLNNVDSMYLSLVSDLFSRPIRILNVYFMKTANILVYGYITVYGYVLNY